MKNSTGTVLRSESLTYLKNSQIDVRAVDGVTTDYDYDGAGRTTSVTQGGVSTGLVWNARGYVSQVGAQTYVINGEGTRVKENGQSLLRSGTGVMVTRDVLYTAIVAALIFPVGACRQTRRRLP